MTGGAFQTSREIFDSSVWMDVIKFRIFFYIYGNAVFAKEGTDVAGIHLKRGQYLRSYRNLLKDLEYVEKRQTKTYSIHTLKRKLEILANENRISFESTEYGTLFTVINYDTYQGFERYEKQTSATGSATPSATVSEQQVNNNKNVKKDKNKKNTSGKPDHTKKADVDFDKFFDWFNQVTERRFQNTPTNRKFVNARLKEKGVTKEDLVKVVVFKTAEWKDTEFKKFLRPSTLFNSEKFEGYLNEVNEQQNQKQRSAKQSTATNVEQDLSDIQAEQQRRAEELYRKEHSELEQRG